MHTPPLSHSPAQHIEKLRDALRQVRDPLTGEDIVTAKRISALTQRGAEVGFMLTLDTAHAPYYREMEIACEQALLTLEGIKSVRIITTTHHDTPTRASASSDMPSPRVLSSASRPSSSRPAAPHNLTPLDGVDRIFAIASGKGGVGKSSVTVLLAHALTALGHRVGICDADIYGPSIPRMLGLENKQPAIQNGKMLPAMAHGIMANSMGLITGDAAAILRGPMVSKSLNQLLRGTDWTYQASRGQSREGRVERAESSKANDSFTSPHREESLSVPSPHREENLSFTSPHREESLSVPSPRRGEDGRGAYNSPASQTSASPNLKHQAVDISALMERENTLTPYDEKTSLDARRSTPATPSTILLIDLPPGTGDVQLSMAQQLPIDGALIVTTAQTVSTIDADKAAQMFQKLGIPILGIIENMSYFTAPDGTHHALFGSGGGSALAAQCSVPLLAELPLDPTIGAALDNGKNPFSAHPENTCLCRLSQLAKTLISSSAALA